MSLSKVIGGFVLFLCIACGKDALNEYPEFEGSWEAYGVYVISEINVEETGKAEHYGKVGDAERTHKGKLKLVCDGTHLQIGTKKWRIDRFPYQENDPWFGGEVWKMNLDSINYVRLNE